eukprot:11222806-Karenia_brevis.AAC.1
MKFSGAPQLVSSEKVQAPMMNSRSKVQGEIRAGGVIIAVPRPIQRWFHSCTSRRHCSRQSCTCENFRPTGTSRCPQCAQL